MLLVLLFLIFNLSASNIDRVILATNANPKYIQFWPIVAQAWQEIVGVRPTLILVAPKSVCVDETYGDVIYFEPLEGLSTSYQAQVIRLFAPILFPDDICMISDIDMLPLQKDFFHESVKHCKEDQVITFWRYPDQLRYSMTYTVGKGALFGDLFNITWQQVPERLYQWEKEGMKWHTDELMLARHLHEWDAITKRFVFLDAERNKRITREGWIKFDPISLKNAGFFDADLPRPYTKYRHKIDALIKDLGLNSPIDMLSVLTFDKKIIQKKYTTAEILITQKDIQSLFQFSGNVEIVDIDRSLTQFFKHKSPQFIHYLKATLQVSDFPALKYLKDALKFHQIALFQFESFDTTPDSKKILNDIVRLLIEHDYVLFKITPHGIMHVPAERDIKSLLGGMHFIAFAPQYARDWSALKK